MYFKIISQKHTFQHNSSSKLVHGLPISFRKVLLFYSNGRTFVYDLHSAKILNSWVLPDKPLKVAMLNSQQILIITQSRKLIELNLSKNNRVVDICKLPRVLTGDELKDRNTFYSIEFITFKKSKGFLIKQTIEDDNKTRITYFNEQKQNGNIKQIQNINTVISPIDQEHTIAVYKQIIDNDKKWQIRIIDLKNSFTQRKFSLDHKSLQNSNSIVCKTLLKNEKQLFIFVNNSTPEIIIFNLQRCDIRQYNYKPSPNFFDIGFYNQDMGIICLYYYCNTVHNGQTHQNLMQIVDTEKGQLIEKSYLTVRKSSASFQGQFILDLPFQYTSGNKSIFYTRHFIKKKSLYLHLMNKTKIASTYGDGLCSKVISILDQR